ncbi:MAG: sigma-70 family RNA polymerase sigma factor [Pseudomonadales bacterium]
MTAEVGEHDVPDPAARSGERTLEPDDGLLAAIADGDGDAFRRLLVNHLDAIHSYLYRMTGSTADAEDLAQETFLRVWRKASTFEPGRVKVTTWIHTIAHNLCIDAFRRNKVTHAEEDVTLADDTADPERLASDGQLAALMERAIAALPGNQRSAILLCQVQGFSNAQAARILGMNVRALESQLARARRTLRQALTAGTGGGER